MNIVAVSRVLNEEDIVEAFVRHNSRVVDHMIFLDNGSSDATLDILHALKAEGLALSIFHGPSLSFDEVSASTWLYRLADQLHQADWVAPLDVDEFLSLPAATTLAAVLATQAPNAMEAMLIHYEDTPEDDPDEPVVPRRLRWRRRAPTGVAKLLLRGGFGPRMVVDAGNHKAFLDGKTLGAAPEPRVALAHYPRRDGYQNLQKILVGWLKVLAAGEAAIAADRAVHYRSPFETLRDKPEELISNPAYLRPPLDRAVLEEAPLHYLGGGLRYTARRDPAMRAVRLGLRYIEQLARQHGRLLDESAEARRLVDAWNGARRFQP